MAKKKITWYCADCRLRRQREKRELPAVTIFGVEWGGCGKEEDGRICGKTEIEIEE